MQDVRHDARDLLPDGRAGGQPRRLDARAVHKGGGAFADDKLVVYFVRAQAAEAGNGLAQRDVFDRQAGFLAHLVQLGGGGGGVFLVVNVGGGGSHQQVAVYRGGDQHALAVLAGQLEHRVFHVSARAVIQQEVIAPARDNRHSIVTYHVVQLVRVDTGGVHDAARVQVALVGMYPPAAVDFFQPGHAGVKLELRAVFGGVFGKGKGQPERAYNAAGGRPQRGDGFVRDVRFHRQKLVALDDAQPLHAVGNAVFVQLLQGGAVRVRQADHQTAAWVVGKIQLLGKSGHHAAALHVQLCHQAAGGSVKARVYNGAVGFGGAAADILLFFQNQNISVVSADFPGSGAACHARPDNDNVLHWCQSSLAHA